MNKHIHTSHIQEYKLNRTDYEPHLLQTYYT